MRWVHTASLRWTGMFLLFGLFAFPPLLAAQEQSTITKTELVRRLENRVEKFRSFTVRYVGKEIFPEGCKNRDVAMIYDDGEAEGNWPPETEVRDIDVEWILRLDDELSVIEVGRSVFNVSSLDFDTVRRRAFFSGKDGPTPVYYDARSGNSGDDAIAIPENTPEYFEGWPANTASNHVDAIGFALFQSIGMAWESGGNPLMRTRVSSDSMSDLRRIGDSRVSFFVADGRGMGHQEFLCDVIDDDEARIVSCILKLSGRTIYEMSYEYTDDGLAKTINAASYDGIGLLSQVELTLTPDGVRRDVPREAAVFPGVPVGGVIRNHDMEHFYVAADGSRVQFDPRVPRSAPPANRGLYLVIGLGAAILVVAFTTYRKLAR